MIDQHPFLPRRGLLVALIASVLVACGTDEAPVDRTDATDHEDSTDDNGFEWFELPGGQAARPAEWLPCDGSHCFDRDEWTLDNIPEFFLSPAVEPWLDYFFMLYGSCTYWEDEHGLVRSRCPEIIFSDGTFSSPNVICPHSWFHSGIGALRSRSGAPTWCVSDERAEKHGGRPSCDNELRCPGGLVCTGQLTADWQDFFGGPRGMPHCIDAPSCLTIESVEWPSRDQSCFYGDLTQPQTGVVAEQDCEALEDGLCAINCPCPEGADPMFPSVCHYVSEQRPVGICGNVNHHCRSDEDCSFYGNMGGMGRVCAGIENPPLWLEDIHELRLERRPTTTIRPNICVHEAACDAWSGLNEGVSCAISRP